MQKQIPTPIAIIIILIIAGIFVGSLYFYLEHFFEVPEIPAAAIILPEREPPAAPLYTLIFVGDIMLDRGVRQMVYREGKGDYRFPFMKIKPYFQEADLLFGNLESMISDKGTDIGGLYSFRAEPEAMQGLIYAGFDIVSVANNHVFDYGRQAMEDTFLRLEKADISYTGGGFTEEQAYSPVIKEIEDTKIAFLAYTNLASPYWTAQKERSGIAWLEKERMQKDIEKAKDLADLLIVSLHYGYEYQPEPNVFQVEISRAAIKAGADLVVGHHPHVIQPVEEYHGGYIAYSLGNFIFDQAFSKETMEGLILKVTVKEGEITEVISEKFKINEHFQPEPPVADQPEEELSEKEPEPAKAAPVPVVKKNPELSGQQVRCLYEVSGVPSPKGVAFRPDGKEFWVTSLMNKARGVVVFNAETGSHVKDIRLPDGGGVEIIFNREGSKAFVSQMETARVFEVDTETKEILRTFHTQSAWTKVLVLSPQENFLYASNWSGNDVSVIDLSSGQAIRRITTIATPRGIYATKDKNFLYVAGFDKGQIQKINLETGESSLLYRSQGAMRHVVADEENRVLYFSDMAKAVILKTDTDTDEVREFARTDINPNTIVLTPDKKVLIVSNRGANHPSGRYDIPGPEPGTILFFSTSSGEKIASLTGGNQPTALDVSPDGQHFIYSDFLDGKLTMCQIPSLL